MNCEQAAEFVSALFDGERIPREAEEHIGACKVCSARLHDYTAMSVELQRAANAIQTDEITIPQWPRQELLFKFWRNGLETMRIPRFAFGLMVVFLLMLSIGLVLTRAKTEDRWFQFSVSTKDGYRIVMATVPTNSKGNPYYDVEAGMPNSEGTVWFHVRVVEQVGEAEKIVAKTLWVPKGELAGERLQNMPEHEFLCSPGENLSIPVDGYGSLKLDGHFEAALPENVRNGPYPENDHLRIYPPVVLIRNKQVLSKADFGGGEVLMTKSYFAFGTQDDGWYVFSAKPIEGAVAGTVTMNQIEFAMEGQRQFLLAGMPITFGSINIWVKRYAAIKDADPFSSWPNNSRNTGSAELAFGELKNLTNYK